MPTPQTVSMLAPDGSSGEIPIDRVDAATKAGFKQAVQMTSPDGKTGYIPIDRQQDALKAGFKAPAAPQEGFFESFGNALGAAQLKDALVNPRQTIVKAVRSVLDPTSGGNAAAIEAGRMYGEGKQAFEAARQNDFAGVEGHLTKAIPFLGPTIQRGYEQNAAGNPAGAAGSAAAAAVQLLAPEALERASAVKDSFYPTSKTPVPAEQAARNLGRALVVPVQGMPDFLKAASPEAGTIKAYAQANNIPINSKVDLANAADATAKAVQGHFDQQILGPHAEDVVSVPPDYRGVKLNTEGSRATVGEINNRINAIRQEMSPNYRKAMQGQTNAANVSDADLLAEKRKLTSLLSDKLSEKTGLSPEDIDAIQIQAGKLRTIADEVNLSANTDTTAAGKAAMGRSDIPTGTKLGLVERGVQAVQGGPEIIGNRMVNRAWKDIDPTSLLLPNPRTTGIAPPEIPNPGIDRIAAIKASRPKRNGL